MSGRLRMVSELCDTGHIEASQKGVMKVKHTGFRSLFKPHGAPFFLKDLILNEDPDVKSALKNYQSGDASGVRRTAYCVDLLQYLTNQQGSLTAAC